MVSNLSHHALLMNNLWQSEIPCMIFRQFIGCIAFGLRPYLFTYITSHMPSLGYSCICFKLYSFSQNKPVLSIAMSIFIAPCTTTHHSLQHFAQSSLISSTTAQNYCSPSSRILQSQRFFGTMSITWLRSATIQGRYMTISLLTTRVEWTGIIESQFQEERPAERRLLR